MSVNTTRTFQSTCGANIGFKIDPEQRQVPQQNGINYSYQYTFKGGCGDGSCSNCQALLQKLGDRFLQTKFT